MTVFTVNAYSMPLNKAEKKKIEEYVKKVSVEDSIGQLLMVGLPVDFDNYKRSTKMDDILIEVGVGSVIVNTYNYLNLPNYSANTYLDSIINFNNAMQQIALDSKLRLPLLFAADFEGPRFSSIRSGVIMPPSALAISATQDKNYINYIGLLAGLQLRNIGIHVIFGPVIDTYKVRQGSESTLQDRCFASTTKGIAATVSHFIKGLKESGISIFAKHFPSYGSVEQNPHLMIPVYSGSPQLLEEEMKPFVLFKDSIDGMMSSHIKISHLQGGEIATFSKEFITEKLRDLGFEEQIIITDDLTSMPAIKQYRKYYNESLSSVAIKAFNAGHDMLLFSHFSEMNKGKSSFSLEDLKQIKNSLIKHIKGSSAEAQFRNSLRKVISLKARIAKDMGATVDEMLDNKKKISIYRILNNGQEALTKSQEFLKKVRNEKIDSGDKLVKEVIRSATFLINKKADFNVNMHLDKRILFCMPKEQYGKFEHVFRSIFQRKPEFIFIPENKDKSFRNFERKINEAYNRNDLLIYLLDDKSDADLLAHLQRQKKDFSKKAVIFCHNTPIIFHDNVLRESTIISNFTNHSVSFDVDIEVLRGDLNPRQLRNLPINLGETGTFYDVESTAWLEPADISKYENLFPKYYTSDYKKLIKKTNILIPKEWRTAVLYLLFLSFMIIVCILWVKISRSYLEKKPEINCNPLSLKFWLYYAMLHHNIIAALVLITTIMLMFYFPEISTVIDRIWSFYQQHKG